MSDEIRHHFPQTVWKEVGEKALQHFWRVLRHTYGGEVVVNCRFRVAPSFVMRSECEMLRISAPRFVFRALLNELGHIDLRRLQLVGEAFQQLGVRNSHRLSVTANVTEEGSLDAHVLLNDRPICGGCLVPPKRLLNRGFRFVDVDLSEELGEPQHIRGIPIINMSALSGGLCAQACLIGSILIMKEFVRNIVGFVELTSLAMGPHLNRAFEMKLGGLSPKAIVDCLNSEEIGLSAHIQGIMDIDNTDWAIQAMRDYVFSGFPVILPCDRKALRHNVYKAPVDLSGDMEPHAVLVVGANANSPEIVVNDPADLPFLPVTDGQRKKIQLRVNGQPIGAELFIEACPKHVKIPLAGSGSVSTHSGLAVESVGLYEVAEILRTSNVHGLPCDVAKDAIYFTRHPGHFRLVPVVSLIENSVEHYFPDIEFSDEMKKSLERLQIVATEQTDWPAWNWVQIRHHPPEALWTFSIWVWDATKELPQFPAEAVLDAGSMRGHLKWCVGSTRPGHELKYFERKAEDCDPSSLRVSVISSFTTSGISHSLRLWPKGVGHCDLYMLMFPDVPKISSEKTSAVSLLAEANNNPDLLNDISQRMLQQITGCFPKGLQVSALATYIPEITASHSDPMRQQGIDALNASIKLAKKIRDEQRLQRCVVEFVCGTRVDSIWKESGRRRAYATIMEPEEAFLRLFEALVQVAAQCDDRVMLAGEVEPGELNVLNSLDGMRRFCELIERYGLTDKVTLNLDISHLMICGVTPLDITEDSRIWRHVSHAHISGHSVKGHLADLVLGRLTPLEEYLTWLQCLVDIVNMQRMSGVGRFGGLVAIEAEALASPSDIWESVSAVRTAISQLRVAS